MAQRQSSKSLQQVRARSVVVVFLTHSLFSNCSGTTTIHSIQEWWGGPEKKDRIWNDYKDARNAIMKKEKDNGDRQILVQDLRQEFRNQYPAYAHMWN